ATARRPVAPRRPEPHLRRRAPHPPRGGPLDRRAPGGGAVAVSDLLGEVTDLTQQMIRNACVNDGSPTSGNETKSAELLASYLDGSGVDVEIYEPLPGRGSLVARLEGSDPAAPTLLLMGHTDVVPVNEDAWQRDPFGGDLVDGEVGGRG